MKSTDAIKGMKIKFALPTKWCEVKDSSPYIWFKGKITSTMNNAIVVSGWNKKHSFRIKNLMCFAYNGEYRKIKKI